MRLKVSGRVRRLVGPTTRDIEWQLGVICRLCTPDVLLTVCCVEGSAAAAAAAGYDDDDDGEEEYDDDYLYFDNDDPVNDERWQMS